MTTADEFIDPQAILLQALSDAAQPDQNGRSLLQEFAATAHAMQWLQVMAVPRLFQSLKRTPDRDHLFMMVDIFIASIRSGRQYVEPEFEGVPYERRVPVAMRLRALVETWPESDVLQIATAVRELLYCNGSIGPEGGWDNVPDPDIPPDEYLLWPEDAGDFRSYTEHVDKPQ
jgi:hypothetical protein